jgi:hypothetical protein
MWQATSVRLGRSQIGRPLRASIFLWLTLLAGAGSSHAQGVDEASMIINDVLSTSAWMSDIETCPSELVQPKEANDGTMSTDCSSGRLKSCLDRCRAGVAGACYWLGQAVQGEGRGQKAAEVLYQQSCKLGVSSGCTNRAAGMSSEREGDDKVQVCAVRTYKKTCELDDPWGCTMYAFHLSKGIGTAVDRELALKVLKKSCRYGPEDAACGYGRGLREQLLKAK